MKIKVAHSPDSDDAFMFYAIAHKKIDFAPYEFEQIMCDIQTLSDKAVNNPEYDLSAISFHAYPHALDNYSLLSSGASMGDNYGPTLICQNNEDPKELLQKVESGDLEVAIPGLLTSAYLTLKLYSPKVQVVAIPFDQITNAVQENKYQAGLVIHEGQLNYEKLGFQKLINLGEWWYKKTDGLPLPLGVNVIKKSLPTEVKNDLSRIMKESIEYSLNNREEALDYALQFGRNLSKEEADKFIDMYVNELTLDLGLRGRKAVENFLEEAYALNLIPKAPILDIV
ncbi:MAG: hypothetical protein QNJ31_00590 [Candidatus Caenarcaniphilales bacterium]|nr:hypothetical protein [Candidatus Caenarcaniphilales bacterium]